MEPMATNKTRFPWMLQPTLSPSLASYALIQISTQSFYQSHATDKKSRLPMVSQKTSEDAKNGGQKEAYGSKSWFGRKLFQSLVSPCRECRAFKPNTPTPTEVEESTMGFRLGIVE
ncbi:hypothetical protein V6N11_018491 [Hibiscus sabdariffa]|uniref:Uncharacterized protein n=1 Tax=Hibiscus sabdariffa TaxID=183260 RepID=A0ABR2T8G5_9ROSI